MKSLKKTRDKKEPLSGKPLVEKAQLTHGLIAHNAAFADTFLYEIFHHFSQCPREISRAIYFTLDSISGRKSLVKRVAKATQKDAETQALLLKLSTAVDKVIKHRNGVAHSFLILHRDLFGLESHIKMINPKQPAPGSSCVTEQSLEEAEDTSNSHLQIVGQAFEKLCEKLGIRPEVTI